MKIAITDVRRGGGRKAINSYTVAYRNLDVLSRELNADLLLNPSDIPKDNDYDAIICGFGSMSCEKDLQTDFLKRNNKAKLFWLVGEYEQSTFAPLFYCNRKFSVIKNFDHEMKNKMIRNQYTVNINTLLSKKSNKVCSKKYPCIYYGRWRPGREKYFKKYLNESMYFSTGSKNIKQFKHIGCNPKLIKPLTWAYGRETLNSFAASLYIEDEFTHTHYNHLGNRFYEALWCNCVPLFDESCVNTLSKSEYKGYEWHIISNTDDIAEKIGDINADVMGRMKRWTEQAMHEKEMVLMDIKKILHKEVNCAC